MEVFALVLPSGLDPFALVASHPERWCALLEDPHRGIAVLASREGEGRAFAADEGDAFAAMFASIEACCDASLLPAPLAIGYLAYEAGAWFDRMPRPKAELHPVAWLHRPRIGVRIEPGRAIVFAADSDAAHAARAWLTEPEAVKLPALPRWGAVRAAPCAEAYCDAVQRVREYIAAGDVFQANIARFFALPCPRDALIGLYARLRRHNPAPFSGWVEVSASEELVLLSSSPERLLCVDAKRVVQSRPIAGTRRRGTGAEDDRLKQELLLSEKERAEHLMLVDLVRNDLGRVAEVGTVQVDELMTIERYATVQHIVSNVRARLAEGKTRLDALAAIFPGGTITGCPKLRCIEIIHELEPGPRGPYTGSLGWIACNGAMDWNILIRTCWWQKGWLHWAAGAGIVADSVPEKELAEVAHKAAGITRALGIQGRM